MHLNIIVSENINSKLIFSEKQNLNQISNYESTIEQLTVYIMYIIYLYII